MTGNQQGQFVRNTQGPRGLPTPTGAIPLPRRRRRPLIDIQAIDAKARQHNAKLAAKRAEAGEQEPEPVNVPPEPPANDSDAPAKTRDFAEAQHRAERGASRGAIPEDDQEAPTGPVPGDTPADDKPPQAPASDATPANTGAGQAESSPKPPAKKAAKKKTARKRAKTTTIQS